MSPERGPVKGLQGPHREVVSLAWRHASLQIQRRDWQSGVRLKQIDRSGGSAGGALLMNWQPCRVCVNARAGVRLDSTLGVETPDAHLT